MPSAKDVCVALTFDYDAMSNWIGSLGATSPGMISRGEFGAIAVRRILDQLDRRGIASTFFVTGSHRPGLSRNRPCDSRRRTRDRPSRLGA